MIDVTRLQQADNRRHPGDYFCATIDDQAVDQAFVAGIPQATAKQTRATGKYPLIELIHVVLVVEQHIDGVKFLPDPRLKSRIDQIEIVGRGDACQRQPKRRRRERVYCHRQRAMEILGQLFHRKM